ncbi:unnamed protein product [Notodromas monacha]|uniref:C2H2-type domain-containing protein n=1 Tax=Notodromas monacha TaxID=399045 RepID=A0A7R9BI24_9CRUS|nr:unnamed protein product [Notodromas monacha]CAG0915042.1 unnamed protein product [Notodromas monacha]
MNQTPSKSSWLVRKARHAGPKEVTQMVCPICGKLMKYSSEQSMRKHIEVVHKKLRTMKCQFCDETFTYHEQLYVHEARIHNHQLDRIIKTCPYCGKTTLTRWGMKQHLFSKHGQLPDKGKVHECADCGKKFLALQHFKDHMNMHLGLRPWACPLCDVRMVKFENIRQHAHRVHNLILVLNDLEAKTEESFKILNGLICREQVEITGTRKVDEEVHEGSRDGFPLSRGTENHTIEQGPSEENLLDVPTIRIRRKRGRPNKIYKQGAVAESDEKTNKNRKVCPLCGKLIKGSEVHVQTHIQVVHYRERKLCCKFCDQKFLYHKSLYAHQARVHDYQPEKVTFQCTECGKVLASKWSFRLHQLSVHNVVPDRLKVYDCSHCPRRFLDVTKYREHVNMHEGIRPHACPHCDVRMVNRKNLKEHIKHLHGESVGPVEGLPYYDRADHVGILSTGSVMDKDADFLHCETCAVCGAQIDAAAADCDTFCLPSSGVSVTSKIQQLRICRCPKNCREFPPDGSMTLPVCDRCLDLVKRIDDLESAFEEHVQLLWQRMTSAPLSSCQEPEKLFEYVIHTAAVVAGVAEDSSSSAVAKVSKSSKIERMCGAFSGDQPQSDDVVASKEEVFSLCEPASYVIERPSQIVAPKSENVDDKTLGSVLKKRKRKKAAPTLCPECGVTFKASSSYMRWHMNTVHNNDKPLECGFCDERFKNYKSRHHHWASKHELEDRIKRQCSRCGLVVSSSWALQQHLLTAHGETSTGKVYSCSQCSKQFLCRSRQIMCSPLPEKPFWLKGDDQTLLEKFRLILSREKANYSPVFDHLCQTRPCFAVYFGTDVRAAAEFEVAYEKSSGSQGVFIMAGIKTSGDVSVVHGFVIWNRLGLSSIPVRDLLVNEGLSTVIEAATGSCELAMGAEITSREAGSALVNCVLAAAFPRAGIMVDIPKMRIISFVQKAEPPVNENAHKSIAVIGCGILGLEFIRELCETRIPGLTRVTVIDPAGISSWDRHHYFKFSTEKYKCDAAANFVRKRIPELQVVPIRAAVQTNCGNDVTSILKDAALWVSCLTSLNAARGVGQLSLDLKKPVIDLSVCGSCEPGAKNKLGFGQVRCFFPNLTESMTCQIESSLSDYPPACVVESFPFETSHCIHWTMESLGSLLTDLQERKICMPENMEGFLSLSLSLFHRWFDAKIRALLRLYPVDQMVDDISPFWSPPKKCPKPLDFDVLNPNHVKFVRYVSIFLSKQINAKVFDEINSLTDDQLCDIVAKLPCAELDIDNEVIEDDPSVLYGPSAIVRMLEKDSLMTQRLVLVIARLRCEAYSIESAPTSQFHREIWEIMSGHELCDVGMCSVAAACAVTRVKSFLSSEGELKNYFFSNVQNPMIQTWTPSLPTVLIHSETRSFTVWDRLMIKGRKDMSLGELCDEVKRILQQRTVTMVVQGRRMLYMKDFTKEDILLEKVQDIISCSVGSIELWFNFEHDGDDVVGPAVMYEWDFS